MYPQINTTAIEARDPVPGPLILPACPRRRSAELLYIILCGSHGFVRVEATYENYRPDVLCSAGPAKASKANLTGHVYRLSQSHG